MQRCLPKCLPKCLVTAALVLAAAVAIGAVWAGSAAGRAQGGARGYARLLAAKNPGPADRSSDCLMAMVLLRDRSGGTGAIPEEQFKALRAYCRVAHAGRLPASAPSPRPGAPAGPATKAPL
ncbi:hypothetical protein [Solidesulfovibrio carbinoliphilus]|uniref:hypothetical protein n=1 Tax=Solidesulfovibrio carbinoliphilus TaxID=345370 RepID=UPI0001C25E86|nr:hypothetical protein [Solidesulfovibrio carbinoliphilus]